MKFFFVLLNACCDFDEDTKVKNAGTANIQAEDIGLIFDWWPLDDLFTSHPEIFCTERLKYLLSAHHLPFSGLTFEEVKRIHTGSNWEENYPKARPGNYWHIRVHGTPLLDDFGTWSEKRYLVVSERAINFLFLNHVTDMMGGEINMDIAEYFSIYEKLLESNNYQTLPPRIFDLIRLVEVLKYSSKSDISLT